MTNQDIDNIIARLALGETVNLQVVTPYPDGMRPVVSLVPDRPAQFGGRVLWRVGWLPEGKTRPVKWILPGHRTLADLCIGMRVVEIMPNNSPKIPLHQPQP